MSHRLAAAALLVVLSSGVVEADLVTRWNFNDYDGNAATIPATSGTGAVILREEGVLWPAAELDAATGTTVNAFDLDPAGTALSLDNNGVETLTRTLTFGLSTTGFTDLVFSAALAGSNSSYDTGLVSYSLDGLTFIETSLSVDPSATGSFELHTVDLSGFSILNNQETLFIRLSLSGDNLVPNQHLLIDNVQFNATPAAVPEAPTWAMLLVSATFLAAIFWRRRSRSSVPEAV